MSDPIPTIKLKKGSCVITVDANEKDFWIKDGFKPVEVDPSKKEGK